MTANSGRSSALRANRTLLWFTRHWLAIALTVLGIYATMPFVAPTLMELGITGPARLIYTLYSPFCHQFAFRTFFLYGEQPAYPRSIVGSDLQPYEAYIVDSPEFQQALQPYLESGRYYPGGEFDPYLFTPALQFASRDFLGSERMGYKMTLCERDVSIYLAMLVGGLLYTIPVVRRKLRPVPIWLYLLLGLGPIGLDGFSQLLGYPTFNLWPARETSPYFRVITGALFGFMNAWLAFPYFELSMRETREKIEEKFARAGIQA